MPTPVRLVSPVVFPTSARFMTQITDPSNAATDASRNVTMGPVDLLAIEYDNMLDLVVNDSKNTKNYLKLYDDASSAWTPGTSKPVFVIPVLGSVAAATDVRGDGIVTAYCLEGYPFKEGISVAAAKEAGDLATSATTKATILQLIHRPIGALIITSAPSPLSTGLRTMALGGSKENLRLLIGQSDNTSHDNITVDNVTIVVYRIRVNCTQNPAEDVYVRLFDTETPTIGTTDAELMVPGKRGRDLTWEFPRGIPFSNLSIATVRSPGATSGNLAPTGIVDLIIDLNSA